MEERQRFAAITIDMDREIDYARVYGEREIEPTREYVYRESLPRILSLLTEINTRATFFIVGRDLLDPSRLRLIKKIVRAGHEIANHTFNHVHNFHLLSPSEKEREIFKMQMLTKQKLGVVPVGFRAPGYNIDQQTIDILSRLKYMYDSSVHPTILHPFLRLALSIKAKGPRTLLQAHGSLDVITRPTEPYHWPNTRLVEIPIRVLPFLRLPFFGTFHLHFGLRSFTLSQSFFRWMRIVNYELHAIDLINQPSGSFRWFRRHPGMHRPLTERLQIYRRIFASLSKEFTLVPLKTIAKNC